MRTISRAALLAAALGCVAGCPQDPGRRAEGVPRFALASANASSDCDVMGCGLNGDIIDRGILFYELDLDGAENTLSVDAATGQPRHGLRIDEVHDRRGNRLEVVIEKDVLKARLEGGAASRDDWNHDGWLTGLELVAPPPPEPAQVEGAVEAAQPPATTPPVAIPGRSVTRPTRAPPRRGAGLTFELSQRYESCELLQCIDECDDRSSDRCAGCRRKRAEGCRLEHSLTLRGYGTTSYWTTGPSPDRVPTYGFEFTFDKNQEHKRRGPTRMALCANENDDTPDVAGRYGTAILFRGDRYQQEDLTARRAGSEEDGWFNIACFGSVVSKMHLYRHTEASADGSATTVAERQTLLKLLTGDYCGVGISFTWPGHPLWFTVDRKAKPMVYDQGAGGWAIPPFAATSTSAPVAGAMTTDAMWGPSGALCLGTPRVLDRAEGCSVRNEIEATCSLPDCETLRWKGATPQLRWQSVLRMNGGPYATSVNPVPFAPVAECTKDPPRFLPPDAGASP